MENNRKSQGIFIWVAESEGRISKAYESKSKTKNGQKNTKKDFVLRKERKLRKKL